MLASLVLALIEPTLQLLNLIGDWLISNEEVWQAKKEEVCLPSHFTPSLHYF